jgi:hypothetical protein
MRTLQTAVLFALALPMAAQAQVQTTDSAGPAKRVWVAMMLEQQECWFRRTVELPKTASRVRLWFTCDNECTVFVDGTEVGRNDDWLKLGNAQLDGERKGKLTVAVHAKNTGGPGALSVWLLWDDADGAHELVTDEEWRVTASEETGWNTPGHDDSKSSSDRAEIRGREQQLIDRNGGAKRHGGTSGNEINAIGENNPNGPVYREAARKRWGG